jgi:hypothetical protein
MNDNSHIQYIIYLWVVAMARGRRQLSAVAISAMSGTCHRPVYDICLVSTQTFSHSSTPSHKADIGVLPTCDVQIDNFVV